MNENIFSTLERGFNLYSLAAEAAGKSLEPANHIVEYVQPLTEIGPACTICNPPVKLKCPFVLLPYT
jgi:hypothetical protein